MPSRVYPARRKLIMHKLPFPDSQCHSCHYLRLSHNKRGSIFLQCRHPDLPKYLPQPMNCCTAFTPANDKSSAQDP
ncbi:MAG: hypothetical protein MJE77_09630 [Proteobacteria bacterium]|nr:hypothetical protein [Pseudomonadota bacterium]